MSREECEAGKPCNSCDIARDCSTKEKEAHEDRRLHQNLFHIRHKIMIMSGKGGVGKSTVAVNLAVALALRAYQVGILDADIHGPDVPKMLGVEDRRLTGQKDGVDPVEIFKGFKAVSMGLMTHDPDRAIVWRGPLKHATIKQFLGNVKWGDLDFLIIDLPPGTGDEPLSVAKLIREVDGAVIVTTPQDVALLDSRKAVNFSELIKIPVLGIVENMAGMLCPHCSGNIDLFKIGGGERAAEELGVPFLGRIPIDPHVVDRCDSGQPFVADSIDSEAKKAFAALTDRVVEAVELSKKPTTAAFEKSRV
jgi:Mrp family chromosome partitioning ATPase